MKASGIAKARNSHARIDQHVMVAAAHIPDIAAQERDDMGLPEQGDGLVDAAHLKTSDQRSSSASLT